MPGENWSEAKAVRRKPTCRLCQALYAKADRRRKKAHRKALGKFLGELGPHPFNREAEEAATKAYLIGEMVWERVMNERRRR